MANPPVPSGVCPSARARAEGGVGSERALATASNSERVQSWPISNNLNADLVKISSGTCQLSC